MPCRHDVIMRYFLLTTLSVADPGCGERGGGRPVVGAGPWGEKSTSKKGRLAYATFATRLIRHWGRPSIQVKHVVKHGVGG